MTCKFCCKKTHKTLFLCYLHWKLISSKHTQKFLETITTYFQHAQVSTQNHTISQTELEGIGLPRAPPQPWAPPEMGTPSSGQQCRASPLSG